MEQRTYTINELKTLIFESASEIKAKVGDGVNSANKKESSSTYKNTKEKIKNFDGGGDEMEVKRNLPDKVDGNKTTLDYEYDGKLDKLRA